MSAFVSAVIVAAGGSVRMGTEDSKQFIPLLSHPVVEYTLRAFEECRYIKEIVLVCRDRDRRRLGDIINENGFKKVTRLVEGGKTRAASVKNGVTAVSGKAKYIAIHDGARPLVTSEDIMRVTEAAFESGAAAPGISVKDTVKIVNGFNKIESTPLRCRLRAVQTPQVFDRELYLFALDAAGERFLDYTDDCALIENMGGEVDIVKGSEENIKITTPIDVIIAEEILRKRLGLKENGGL